MKAPGSPWPSPVHTSLLCLFIQRSLFLISTCHWDHGRTFDTMPFMCCCAEQQHTVPPLAPSSKKAIYLAEFARWWKCSPRIPGENHIPLSLTQSHLALTVLHWYPKTNTNILLFPRWQFPEGFGFFLFPCSYVPLVEPETLWPSPTQLSSHEQRNFVGGLKGFFHLGCFSFTVQGLY